MIKFNYGMNEVRGDYATIITEFLSGVERYLQDKELRNLTMNAILIEGSAKLLQPSQFWVEFAELIRKYNNEFENKEPKDESDPDEDNLIEMY